MTKKTLDEHAEAVERRNDVPLDRAYANIFAAYEAERAARIDLERQYLCAKCQHNEARVRELEAERDEALVAAEMWSDNAKAIAASRSRALARAEKAEARVRELEVERDALVTAEAYGQATAALAETRAQLERMARRERLLVEEVNGLREEANGLEAQLATLREAAEAVDEADASGDDTVLGVAIRRLRAALSTTGPTLAEIRRAAQVEVLRELAKEMAPPAAPTMGSATWDAWRERIARRFGTFDAVAIHDWLRQRADDLEAGRG